MLGAPDSTIKERLGHAVVELIATRAGCQLTQPYTDLKSIDVNISPMTSKLPIQIDAQIKGVTTLVEKKDHFEYKLKRRNFDHLRQNDVVIPRVLFVADITKDPKMWVTCHPESVEFCRGVYWCDLFDMPSPSQSSSVPIKIPFENKLDPEVLVELMKRAYGNAKSGKGGVS